MRKALAILATVATVGATTISAPAQALIPSSFPRDRFSSRARAAAQRLQHAIPAVGLPLSSLAAQESRLFRNRRGSCHGVQFRRPSVAPRGCPRK